MTKRSNTVAKSEPADLVVLADRDIEVPAYIKHKGPARGSENVTSDDLVIPRLEITQALSPCIDKGDPSYIPGAEAGMLFNSVTRQLYGDTVIFIPVVFKQEYLLWRDRKKGGGFAGAHPDIDAANAAIQQLDDPENWEAIPTAQHFGLLISDSTGSFEETVISMAKTKLKVSRKFNTLIRMNEGDRFSRAYLVSAVQEQNNEGQKYYNFAIKNYGFPSESVYMAAEHLWSSVHKGDRAIEADRSEEGVVASTSESEF